MIDVKIPSAGEFTPEDTLMADLLNEPVIGYDPSRLPPKLVNPSAELEGVKVKETRQ